MTAKNVLDDDSHKGWQDVLIVTVAISAIAFGIWGIFFAPYPDCPEKPETKFMHGEVERVQADFLTGGEPYTISIDGFEDTSPSGHILSVGFGENILGQIEEGDYIIVYVNWTCTEACTDPDWHYWVPYAKDWKIVEDNLHG